MNAAGEGRLGSALINIDSVSDARLADFANLRSRPSGRVRDTASFVVEGQLLVERLVASDYPVRSIVVEQGRDLAVLRDADPATPVYQLSHDQIRQLAGFDFHRGFLASAARAPWLGIEAFQPDSVSLAVIRTTDMENLGSMLRSAAAFGIRQVLIDKQSVDVFSRRVLRVSMGAAFGMRLLAMTDPTTDLRYLKTRGVTSLAATLASNSIAINQVHLDSRPVLIVMGNEADGLPLEVQHAASKCVTIPMRAAAGAGGLVDSLNVSVAAAILMHELTRDRGTLEREG